MFGSVLVLRLNLVFCLYGYGFRRSVFELLLFFYGVFFSGVISLPVHVVSGCLLAGSK